MIIGKDSKNFNSPKFTSNFDERFNKVKNFNYNKSQILDESKKYTNIKNKNEILNKSFLMLQERYNNGLISIEEFTKKCEQLNKTRQK